MCEIRIAKAIAKSGITSRRGAEKLIEEGRVRCDGELVKTAVLFVNKNNKITVDNKVIQDNSSDIRLWCFYKPVGFLTTRSDPNGRKTIFDIINLNFPRLLYVGRLDLNSEGLLLLTNNGPLARYFELPKSKIKRVYKVRAYGKLNDNIIKSLENGVVINGFSYGKMNVNILSNQGKNIWLKLTLREGKNREIRKILEHFGLRVNRLIRIAYHTFELENLKPGEIKEVSKEKLSRIIESMNE